METKANNNVSTNEPKKHKLKKTNALHQALLRNDVEKIKRLLNEEGADPNAKNPKNFTPLHYAMGNSTPEVIQLLIEKGADPNKYNYEFMNPLIVGILSDQTENVKALLQACKDRNVTIKVNEKNMFGENAIHYAATHGSLATIPMLVENGADINSEGLLGETPMLFAFQNKHMNAFELIKTFGGTMKKPNPEPALPTGNLPNFAMPGGHLDDDRLRKMEDTFGGSPIVTGYPEVFYTGKKPAIGMGASIKFNFHKNHIIVGRDNKKITFTWLDGLINWVADDLLSFKVVVRNNVDHQGVLTHLKGDWEGTLVWFPYKQVPWILTSLVKLKDAQIKERGFGVIEQKSLEIQQQRGRRVEYTPSRCTILKGAVHNHNHGHSHNQQHEHSHDCDHSHDHDHDHSHSHDHGHSHSHSHSHGHDHGHSHSHDHGHDHGHDHKHEHGENCDHDHEHEHEQEQEDELPPRVIVGVEYEPKSNVIVYHYEDGETDTQKNGNAKAWFEQIIRQNDDLRKKGTGVWVKLNGRDLYPKKA